MTPSTLAPAPTLAPSPSIAVAAPSLAVEADALAAPAGLGAIVADCSRLIRPRIALMVLVTVVASLWLTADADRLPSDRVAWLLLGTALVAASSSIANQKDRTVNGTVAIDRRATVGR